MAFSSPQLASLGSASAEATREWFRAFTAHSFLACRPLRPRGVRHQYPETSMPTLAFAERPPARHSQHSRNPFHAGGRFRGFTGSLPLRPARLLAPLYGSDWNVQPSGTFTSRLSTDRSPSPLLDITTTETGLLCWRDSHPLEWQLASLHGHSLPIHSAPMSTNVRYAPNSDHSRHGSELTRCAKSDIMRVISR